MKRFIHILPFLLLAALLSAGACQRLPGTDETEEYGTLTLQVSPGETGTKAGAPDGDSFHNILVVVADKDGAVKASVFKQYPCTEAQGNVPANQDEKDVESTDSDWIYFINLKVGYYQVYAYANIDAVAWQQADISALSDINAIAAKITEGTGFPDRQLVTLPPPEKATPAVPGGNDYMLLTGHDELYVGVDPYIGRIDLYRPVVKFEVVLDNHTPYPIQLTDLHFNDFNASDSYLIGRKDADGNPILPGGNSYRPLPAFPGPANIPARSQATVYSKLLYENRLGQDYRMFATVRFANPDGSAVQDESGQHYLTDNTEASGTPLSRILTSASVRRVPYSDILGMANNSSMNVLAVTPNTGNGGFLGWIFTQGSSSGQLAFSAATYNFEDSFRSKAESLLNDKDIGAYYQLRLDKDNAGKYHLSRADKDLFKFTQGNTSVDGLYLKEGHIPTEYPISQEFTGSLCRFTETEATNAKSLYYLNSALKLDSNANVGNRMWTFYEIHPVGTVLKLIDRESSRVSTLTRMVRGQKLTAVMNVYYQSETGEFTFSLDNAYWEDGHNPKHMFQ